MQLHAQAPGAWDVYNFLRKPASDFGWDWGPAFAPAGVHGVVELLGFDKALLTGES
jgi:beta-mannosidase